jgi:outer membrane protein assembly factor BamB
LDARLTSVGFPRGVADPATGRAFTRDRSGTVVALDLATGRIVWRAGTGLRPLAVVGDRLVAARPSDGALRIATLHADDGRELGEATLELPDWVRPTLDDGPGFTLESEVAGRDLLLRWTARNRYRGGAPPGAKAAAARARDASGAALLNVDTGALEPRAVEASSSAVRSARQTSGPAAADPDVIEQHDVGESRFQLVAREVADGRVDVTIRALEPKTGRVIWETVVEKVAAPRPSPLRPRAGAPASPSNERGGPDRGSHR